MVVIFCLQQYFSLGNALVPRLTRTTAMSNVRKSPRRQSTVNNNNNGNNKPTVAVIGGGIAGLSCAQHLAQGGRYAATVFDTGRLRPGGRCSSRLAGDTPSDDATTTYPLLDQHMIDHAAQILTVPAWDTSNKFRQQVEDWEAQGVVKKYPQGTVCNIMDASNNNNNNGKKNMDSESESVENRFVLEPVNTACRPPMYYGTRGMGFIPQAIEQASTAQLEQDVWVAPSNGVRYQKDTQKWKLQAKGQSLGIFDHLVIAHNGKCADRIMSKTPAKGVHNLLRVNFNPRVPPWGGNRMTLNSIYSLSFALPSESILDRALPVDTFVCGFVKNEPTLRFLSCQTRKYEPLSSDVEADVQVWTILSSSTFAKKYKAPQEFLPPDVVQNVTTLLFQGLERSLNLVSGTLEENVLESRLQLWGAAVPVNVWKSNSSDTSSRDAGFLHDPEHTVGVCGDWLLDPSIAGAWESGRRLAEYMTQHDPDKAQAIGLEGSFQANKEAMQAGIGSLAEITT